MGTPWLIVFLAASAAATTTLCPDGTTCDEDHLCCELSGNQGYGCCSKEEVVSRSLPMISTVKSCSDLTSCPTEYSCVETPQGNSACCPLPQGSSCQDGNHCCPSGTVCSEDGHHCIPASNLTAVICPDGKSECPNDSTCCILPNQSWGCCPIPQASCCSDHLHCCPQSTVCDLQHGRCVSGDGTESPWMNKLPARVRLVAMGDSFKRTQCSDGSSCPNGATCCQQKDGTYGCCPFTDGVCCRDYVHCCPSGTLCDLSHQKCTSKSMEMPLFTRTPALKAEDTDVKCDDATSCPGDSTCCRLQSGEWGCCPISGAVCCDDHVHCCPGGFTCSGSQCIGDGVSIPLLRKGPALQHKDIYVQCNDTAYCPDKETCCLLETGQWGCCPLEHAVCCDDHEHCCPSGYTCTGGQCSQGMVSTPGLKKTPALSKPSAAGAGNVRCDDETSCPDESTCCRTESGEWGCCPIEKGVCCSDHLHCCPEGYTCDVSAGSCVKPQLDTEPEQAAPMTPIQPLNYVWCDAQYACNDFQTCCRGLSTLWICCPLYQAVCCPDRMHCCPYGHICLNSGAACSRSGPLRWDGKTEPHTLL